MRRPTLIVLLAAVLAACGSPAPTDTPESEPAPAETVGVSEEAARAAGIETEIARAVERTDRLRAAGVVAFDERRTSRLGSLVDGIVSEVGVQPGNSIRAGTVVARLHSHVIHDAWAAYFTALASRERAAAELAYARTAETRAASLVADKALSPQELERARADLSATTQAELAARAEVVRAEQELRHYGLEPSPGSDPHLNDQIPVRTPISGIVIERAVSPGSVVQPGTPVAVVSDLSRVWVVAEVDESALARVAVGGSVDVHVVAYPDETFHGTLTFIGDVVNPSTRRVAIRAEVANPDRHLKPQMFATVVVGAAGPRRTIVIPARAVQAIGGESIVFVRDAKGQFVRRAVVTGAEVDGAIEILRGLEEGETVATAGAFLLKSEVLNPASGDQ
jgi:cobalt-zinc-cadmium efflux system membrane fusion protein